MLNLKISNFKILSCKTNQSNVLQQLCSKLTKYFYTRIVESQNSKASRIEFSARPDQHIISNNNCTYSIILLICCQKLTSYILQNILHAHSQTKTFSASRIILSESRTVNKIINCYGWHHLSCSVRSDVLFTWTLGF